MRPHVPVLVALGVLLLSSGAAAQVPGPPRAFPARRGLDRQLPRPKPAPRPLPLVPTDYVVRCSEPTSSGEDLNVALTAPLPGAVSSAYAPDCPTVAVAGTAGVGKLLADIYFVIDSSGSTARCTGSDIDGDGETGVPNPFGFFSCSDPGDTVLAAEVRAVRDFVATLSPTVTRVAIIQFSMPEGTFGRGERQRIVAPLTADFARVGAALDEIQLAGPAGATDYGGAVQLLLQEYTTHGDRILRRQLCYFLSDGVPTYPVPDYGTEDPGDSQSALDATDVAAAAGIRLDTFGVGFIPSTTRDPIIPRRCIKPTPLGPVETSTL